MNSRRGDLHVNIRRKNRQGNWWTFMGRREGGKRGKDRDSWRQKKEGKKGRSELSPWVLLCGCFEKKKKKKIAMKRETKVEWRVEEYRSLLTGGNLQSAKG